MSCECKNVILALDGIKVVKETSFIVPTQFGLSCQQYPIAALAVLGQSFLLG